MPTPAYAGLDNPVNPWDPATASPNPTLPQASAGTGLYVANPVNSATAGLDQSLQARTARQLGVGNNPNVVTDPNTGKLYSTTSPVTPRDTNELYVGTDGKRYQKVGSHWFEQSVDQNGNTSALAYVDDHDQRLKGLKPFTPQAPVTTDLHAQDPGWQIQQGVADAAGLDPAKNAMLQAAGLSANNLASGAVGDAMAAQVNPYLTATQGRIDQQASDLGIIRNSAEGRGPSAAENLAKAQLDANIRSQSAMAATARGGNIAAAMRQAANSGTQQSLQSAATIAAQRAQEQLNAQGLLTTGANNLTGAQGRLGDQGAGLASSRAQLIQGGQAAQANVAGQTSNDLANMNAQKQQAAAKYAEYLMNLYQISSGNNVAYSGQGVQAGIANANTTANLIGGGLNAGGSAITSALG